MNPSIEEFIEIARSVTIDAAAKRLGLAFRKAGAEHPQPCPACSGKDCFAFNTKKNKWNCRAAGVGGQDGIGMAAHALGLDLKSREGFLEACSAVTGEDIPEGGERESEEDRAARLERLDRLKTDNEQAAAGRAQAQGEFRERERKKARGIYDAAAPLFSSVLPHGRLYLQHRGGGFTERWLRVSADQPYWHGEDDRGQLQALHTGPAMVTPFIDAGGVVIGCHITWIDLGLAPKFRPELSDPSTGELLPTKKMRGTKKGGLIPLAGDPSARRWVGGEGIENGLAFGRWEGFRDDTFYFAAGDLGNLSGPAEASSRFAHPTLTKPDRNLVERPVMIAGPVPKLDQDADDAMFVLDHVDELVLLADGDSERVMTASAMARARARHARPGRLIPIIWPCNGHDFASMAVSAETEAS
jgi:hypothetical protein